jgi:rSAM/selenodomain-associated transferase 1
VNGVRTILVLAKYPEPGRVKTRLAATAGPERAATLYRRWIEVVLAALQPLRGRARLVCYFDGAPRASFAAWEGLADDWWPQPAGDLGERLAAGFRRGLAGGPVIAVGTDCLEMDAALVGGVFDLLAAGRDAVFGPTPDGGYYLVGMSAELPGLFTGVRWSGPHTLEDHLSRCREQGWSYDLLPARHDIDTWADWTDYLKRATVTGGRLMTLAVVIPTLNEQAALPGLLDTLKGQSAPAERVVVSDGGSADDTVGVARRWEAEVVLAPGRGRGGQVAAALPAVAEEAVLVAHADMRLPEDALAAIRNWLHAHPECPGGCLGHRFDRRTFALRVVEWFDARRARRGESYGDQGQFFRVGRLRSAGGFPDQSIMEDIELSRRLRPLGVPAYLDVPVTVSARRFERLGWPRVLWTNWLLRRRYRRDGLEACLDLYRTYYGGVSGLSGGR